MKERPIIFNTEMVKAILDGRKTVTRRPVTFKEGNNFKISRDCYSEKGYQTLDNCTIPPSIKIEPFDSAKKIQWYLKCPFGQIGDRLYVRETFYNYGYWIKNGKSKIGKQKYKFVVNENYDTKYIDCPPHKVITSKNETGWFKRPSIHMPKKYARIWLEITDIRVTKVQYLTEREAYNEGFIRIHKLKKSDNYPGFEHTGDYISPKEQFGKFWNDAYNNWSENPWVWVIEFKRVEK